VTSTLGLSAPGSVGLSGVAARVLLVVRWGLRDKLRPRDQTELFLARGVAFTHETVRDRETRFAPRITAQGRPPRKGKTTWVWLP
jgi:transposase-like protein